MRVAERDLKVLWARAAGRCSRPGCAVDCIQFNTNSDFTILGEMAHIIAQSPNGPRGQSSAGADTYDNLILLCPTHHTEVDASAPGQYSEHTLRTWKRQHEETISGKLCGHRFTDKRDLFREVQRLLIANKVTWSIYGPESDEARRNPLSNNHELWVLRKLSSIVPNNRRVINLIEQSRALLDPEDIAVFARFVEHAEGFERNCYVPTEGIQRFPVSFEEMVGRYAGIQ